MKINKIPNAILLATATLILSWAGVPISSAQTNPNLFPAAVNLVCISTNPAGELVYERVNNSNFIEECAFEMGVSNLTELSLVFNRSNSSLEIVSGTNQAVLCSPLSFEGGLALANSNNTRVVWHSFVFVDTNTVASGLLSATERYRWGLSNQLTSFSLRGRLNYSEAGDGTNSPAICRGTLLVGDAITRDEDDDDDDGNGKNCNHGDDGHGNHGNNGNHGEGNNGNHGQGNHGNPGAAGKGKR